MLLGTVFGLLAAVCWSVANVSIKSSSERYGSWGSLVWTQLIGGTMVVWLAHTQDGGLVFSDFNSEAGHTKNGWILLGGVSALAAYGGLFNALRLGQVSVVIPVVSTWVVVSVVIAIGLFDEGLSGLATFGVIMVVGSNMLLAKYSQNEENDKNTPKKALFWAVISSVGFGVMAPCVAVVGKTHGAYWALPLIWGAELIILLPIVALNQNPLELRNYLPNNLNDVWLAIRVAIFETAGFLALSLGLEAAPVRLVTPISSLATGISVVLGVIWLKERVQKPILIGAFFASIGVVLVNL